MTKKMNTPFIVHKIPFVCHKRTPDVPFVYRNIPLVGFDNFSRNFSAGASGFTLVELMVTLIVVAVLVFAGVPAFRDMVDSNRMTSATNDLLTDIKTGRSKAQTQKGKIVGGFSGQVVMCVSSNMTNCTPGANTWRNGWITFWDQDRNGTVSGANDKILSTHAPLSDSFEVVTDPADANSITFDSAGNTSGLASIQITNPRTGQSRSICVPSAGQVSIRQSCT